MALSQSESHSPLSSWEDEGPGKKWLSIARHQEGLSVPGQAVACQREVAALQHPDCSRETVTQVRISFWVTVLGRNPGQHGPPG